MAYSVYIDPYTIEPLLGSLLIDYNLNARNTAKFRLYYANGYRPVEGSEVFVWDGGTKIFGGSVDQVDERGAADHATHPGLYHDVSCTSFERLIDKRLTFDVITGECPAYKSYSGTCNTSGTAVTWVSSLDADLEETSAYFTQDLVGRTITINVTNYVVSSVTSPTALVLTGSAGSQSSVSYSAPIYAGQIVTDLVTNWCQFENISLDDGASPPVSTIGLGAQVTSLIADYRNLSEVFTELATLSDYIWYIDANRVLYFRDRTTTLAPFDITSATKVRNFEKSNTREDLANSESRRVNWGALSVTEQTFTGDGSTRVWEVTNQSVSPAVAGRLAKIESVLVNGVEMTFGIRGVDKGQGFYYGVGESLVSQNPNDTVLGLTDTLLIQYRVLGADVITYDDEAMHAAREAAEPATSGRYQHYTDDANSMDAVNSLAKATAYVNSYGVTPATIQYDVCTLMVSTANQLAVGQVQNVTVAKYNISNVNFLITHIQAKDGPWDVASDERVLWYHVTAATGSYITDGFLETFERFLSGGTTSSVSSGQGVRSDVASLEPIGYYW